MAKLVNIEHARVARLADELRPTLKARGSVLARGVADVDQWRKAARFAARGLGWRVRTGVAKDGSAVWAVALDYEASPEQVWDAVRRMGELYGSYGMRPRRPRR